MSSIEQPPVLDMSGDVILLDIDSIVPPWDIYTFSLNIQEPGVKVSFVWSRHNTSLIPTIANCYSRETATSQQGKRVRSFFNLMCGF